MKPAVFLFALLLLPGAARANSLYPIGTATAPASAAAVSLFADNKARHVGDTLTILIQETASAASQGATKTANTESLNYGPGFGPLLHLIKNFGVTGSLSGSGSGSTSRSDNLTARIAVTVKQVLPNGNLLVEGTRRVGMNAETQEITLTGTVRPQDIAPDNSIASPLVADAQIKFGGKGPVGDTQRPGVITRLFKFLF